MNGGDPGCNNINSGAVAQSYSELSAHRSQKLEHTVIEDHLWQQVLPDKGMFAGLHYTLFRLSGCCSGLWVKIIGRGFQSTMGNMCMDKRNALHRPPSARWALTWSLKDFYTTRMSGSSIKLLYVTFVDSGVWFIGGCHTSRKERACTSPNIFSCIISLCNDLCCDWSLIA